MRLVRSDPSAPGIRRLRCGRGFRYLAPDGRPLRDQESLDRVSGLAIPPAWRNVWVSPDPNGHLQAVGTDDAGRRQYLYHEQWRRERDEEKHDRVLELARRLPRWRARVAGDLHGRGLHRNRVLAASLRMIDRGVFRVGSEEYAEEHGTRGAATLLKEDVTLRRHVIIFRYTAKGGIERALSISDEELAAVVKALRRARSGSERLLVYRDTDGWHEVRAEQINDRFKELAGPQFTAKDLRTWHATVLAAAAFAAAGPASSKRALKRTQAAVMRKVAEELGNTPAVARKSYVDPRVGRAYEEGATIESALRRLGGTGVRGEREQHVLERAVIRLLSGRDHV
ncbi:DNA topoisomerase IB [Amycolatopsis cynarae]|uniref:DNA topoisomerase n=1 Tax=Amycolatopsis cynarae TaxID=2995223 RepID=A0ABY7B6E1_9PSEU|nr:DNA topoisomerase IB [Amycolatopsis sp. HUAS 11-8]WAL67499.1 DNA topoisomerase IB [Amycolatopsis sp. HUAS 11-8]